MPLRAPPTDVTAGSGALWVAEPAAGLVARVDPQRRTVTATIPVGTDPRHRYRRGRPGLCSAPGPYPIPDRPADRHGGPDHRPECPPPGDVLLSMGQLWVASPDAGTVLRISPATGRIVGTVHTGGNPGALAAIDGAVWAAADQTSDVTRIDARTGAVTDTIRVGDAPGRPGLRSVRTMGTRSAGRDRLAGRSWAGPRSR